jgi:hypothetical protein
MLVVSLAMLTPLWAQQPSAPLQHDPIVEQMTVLAREFEGRARMAAAVMTSASLEIVVDTPPELSVYEGPNKVHTARWEDLPPDGQAIFDRFATYAGAMTGKQFFDDMFHRFFFVHEMAHWLQRQAKDPRDGYQFELDANRVTVAYWREKDSAYLAALLVEFKRLNERLPVPVPPGQDPQEYFDANKGKLGSNPDVYGWFQSRMVLEAAAERPVLTFSEAVRGLSAHANDPVQQ